MTSPADDTNTEPLPYALGFVRTTHPDADGQLQDVVYPNTPYFLDRLRERGATWTPLTIGRDLETND